MRSIRFSRKVLKFHQTGRASWKRWGLEMGTFLN